METVVWMHPSLKGEVLDGSRTSAWRPSHRDYALGPATILFIGDSTVIDIILTKVEHTIASGKYAAFMMFMRDMGQMEEDDGKITLLEWKLA